MSSSCASRMLLALLVGLASFSPAKAEICPGEVVLYGCGVTKKGSEKAANSETEAVKNMRAPRWFLLLSKTEIRGKRER